MSNGINIPNIDLGEGKLIHCDIGINGNLNARIYNDDGSDLILDDIIKTLGTINVIMLCKFFNEGKEKLEEAIKAGNKVEEDTLYIFANSLLEEKYKPFLSSIDNIIVNSVTNFLMKHIQQEKSPVIKMYFIKLLESLSNENFEEINKKYNIEVKETKED